MAKKALVIGVNNYANNPHRRYDSVNETHVALGTLNRAAEDAQRIAKVLSGTEYRDRYAWEVTCLSDGGDTEPTAANFDRKFDEIKAACGADDDFLFYFAGHATTASNIPNDVPVLQMSDGEGPLMSALAQIQDRAAPPRTVTILLDCCFSGKLMEYRRHSEVQEPTYSYFVASGSDQNAFDTPHNGALFSGVLIDGLKGAGLQPDDHEVTQHNLRAYMEGQMRAISDKQKPEYWVTQIHTVVFSRPDRTSASQAKLRATDRVAHIPLVVSSAGSRPLAEMIRRGRPLVELNQRGTQIEIAQINRVTEERHVWDDKVKVEEGMRSIAVSGALKRHALIVLTGNGRTELWLVRQDGGRRMRWLLEERECLEADFLSGGKLGNIQLTGRGASRYLVDVTALGQGEEIG